MANQCTKFEVSSFSHINRSRDHSHAPSRDDMGQRNKDQAVTLCNKFEIFTLTHCEDMKGDKNAEIGVVWGLGVTQGHRPNCDSIEHIVTFYSTLIEIMCLSCTVF